MPFRAEGREKMVADHAYSPGSLPFMDRRARLFYFAAAVPVVGFMHGSADVSPVNEAMLGSYADGSFPWQAERAAHRPQEACRLAIRLPGRHDNGEKWS
jgi:hypothetical protein